jgi:prevent-host-death family protein
MKPTHISRDIVTVEELTSRASALIRGARRRSRPLVITQNGRRVAVLLSVEDFDRLTERARFVDAIDRGLEDSRMGRVTSDHDLGRMLDRAFGRRRK